MKKHLNTLYVTTQGAYVGKEGEAVTVRVEGKTKLRVPVHNLEGVVCFGNVLFSPFLLGHCARRGVLVSFLTQNGRFLARVHGPVSGNVLLRREQFRCADDLEIAAVIARNIVAAKLSNSRAVLMRWLRDYSGVDGVSETRRATRFLARALRTISKGRVTLGRLRGIEGSAAREYFGVFDHLIVRQKEEFQFPGRNRRPPRDRVNALLSFLYTLVLHDISSALEAVGLDPAVGFLHRDRPGRPGLALDLLEELRSYLADRLALSLINLRQVTAGDFDLTPGSAQLTEKGRRKVLMAYQKRKDERLQHPFLKEKTCVGMLGHLQALLLARCFRGDLDGYPPFLAR